MYSTRIQAGMLWRLHTRCQDGHGVRCSITQQRHSHWMPRQVRQRLKSCIHAASVGKVQHSHSRGPRERDVQPGAVRFPGDASDRGERIRAQQRAIALRNRQVVRQKLQEQAHRRERHIIVPDSLHYCGQRTQCGIRRLRVRAMHAMRYLQELERNRRDPV